MLIMAKSNACPISSFNKTGINEGGEETIPLNLIRLRANAMEVTKKIPITIAPGIFLIESTAITKKPIIAKIVSGFVRSPMLRRVASFEVIIPPLFRPIIPINKPTPAPIAIRKLKGMLSNIHCLKGVTLI